MPGALIALVKFTVVVLKQNPQELDAFASSFSQVQLGMPQKGHFWQTQMSS